MYCYLSWIAHLFSALGAINWGLMAFFNFNMVSSVTKVIRIKNLDKVLYGFIALCGVYSLMSLFTHGSMRMMMGSMY